MDSLFLALRGLKGISVGSRNSGSAVHPRVRRQPRELRCAWKPKMSKIITGGIAAAADKAAEG